MIDRLNIGQRRQAAAIGQASQQQESCRTPPSITPDHDTDVPWNTLAKLTMRIIAPFGNFAARIIRRGTDERVAMVSDLHVACAAVLALLVVLSASAAAQVSREWAFPGVGAATRKSEARASEVVRLPGSPVIFHRSDLTNPQALVRGRKMPFEGIVDAQDRAGDAYLSDAAQ